MSGIGDVDEHEQAGGGLPEDAIERGAEGGDGEEHQGGEGEDGEGVHGAEEGGEEEERDGGDDPPEGDGAAAGAGEGAELPCGEAGDDGGEDRDHPELAEEDQRCDECDEDECGENALHVPC